MIFRARHSCGSSDILKLHISFIEVKLILNCITCKIDVLQTILIDIENRYATTIKIIGIIEDIVFSLLYHFVFEFDAGLR